MSFCIIMTSSIIDSSSVIAIIDFIVIINIFITIVINIFIVIIIIYQHHGARIIIIYNLWMDIHGDAFITITLIQDNIQIVSCPPVAKLHENPRRASLTNIWLQYEQCNYAKLQVIRDYCR